MRVPGLILIVTAVAGCSNNSGLTGSYIDTDYSGGVMMVQIDSVDHRDVHGTISMATFDKSGAVSSSRVPISGTIEGKALNMNIENGTGTAMLNGTVVPDGLDLTMMGNGGSARFLFKRKDAAEFSRAIASLRTQAAQDHQQVQNAAFQAQQEAEKSALAEQDSERVVQVQSEINSEADQLLTDAPAITAKAAQVANALIYYRRISDRNAQLKAMAARINSKSDDAASSLSDIDYRVENNRNLAATAHTEVQTFWTNVEGQSQGHFSRANQLIADCQADSRLSCNRLPDAISRYGQSVATLRDAIAKENSAFEADRSRF